MRLAALPNLSSNLVSGLEQCGIRTEADLLFSGSTLDVFRRLPAETTTLKELAELMEECWQEDPKARPSFFIIATRRLPKIYEAINDLSLIYSVPQPVSEQQVNIEPPVFISIEDEAKGKSFPPTQAVRYLVELQIDEGYRERGVLEMSTRGLSFFSKELRSLKEVFSHAWVHVRSFKTKNNVFTYYWQPFPDYQKRYVFFSNDLVAVINARAGEIMRELSKSLIEFRKQEKAKSKEAFVASRLEQQKKEESEARSRVDKAPSGTSTSHAQVTDHITEDPKTPKSELATATAPAVSTPPPDDD